MASRSSRGTTLRQIPSPRQRIFSLPKNRMMMNQKAKEATTKRQTPKRQRKNLLP